MQGEPGSRLIRGIRLGAVRDSIIKEQSPAGAQLHCNRAILVGVTPDMMVTPAVPGVFELFPMDALRGPHALRVDCAEWSDCLTNKNV